jgi:hypothetical protein
MGRKIKLFFAFSALLLTVCKCYDDRGAVTSTNGLSCENYTDYGFSAWGGEGRAECFYICPDGTVRQPDIPGKLSASSPLYSASKADLDSQFCPGVPQPTPTQPPASPPPTLAASPTAQASATAEISPTAPPPLLTGEVPSCDKSMNLINFRMVEPAPDLTGKTLTVQISDVESTCAVNPLNASLLTCKSPVPLTFPTRVVVRLDGVVINDFTDNGLGCITN